MILAPHDVEAMAEDHMTYYTSFHDLCQYRKPRERSAFYLRSLLSKLLE
jgi:hypothetical protein